MEGSQSFLNVYELLRSIIYMLLRYISSYQFVLRGFAKHHTATFSHRGTEVSTHEVPVIPERVIAVYCPPARRLSSPTLHPRRPAGLNACRHAPRAARRGKSVASISKPSCPGPAADIDPSTPPFDPSTPLFRPATAAAASP